MDTHLMEPEEGRKSIGDGVHGKQCRHDLLEFDLPCPVYCISKDKQCVDHDQSSIVLVVSILDKYGAQCTKNRRIAENTALPGRIDYSHTPHQFKSSDGRQQRQRHHQHHHRCPQNHYQDHRHAYYRYQQP